MTYITILLFNLLITAGAYCIIPLAVAGLRKASITRKKYRIICIVVTIVIAFAFQFWRSYAGVSGGSFWPAILWGTIFYDVGISILRNRGLLSDSASTKPTEQPPVKPSSAAPKAPVTEVSPESAPKQNTPVHLDSQPPAIKTWYTCPYCGSVVATGKPCDCGYCPPPADSF